MMPVVEFVASKIADQLMDRVIESFRHRLDAEYSALLDRLASIDAKIDAQLLAPLKSGLTFLQLGDLGNALVEFVRAQAVDPYAASSALCLGLLLQKLGRSEEGRRFIDESLQLNPFIVEGLVPPMSLAPPPNIDTSRPRQPIWHVYLNDQSILGTLPRKPFEGPGGPVRSRSQAAVRN